MVFEAKLKSKESFENSVPVLKTKSKCETKDKVRTRISPHLVDYNDSNNIVVAMATGLLLLCTQSMFYTKSWDMIFTYFDE